MRIQIPVQELVIDEAEPVEVDSVAAEPVVLALALVASLLVPATALGQPLVHFR